MKKLIKILAVMFVGFMLSTSVVLAMASKPAVKSRQWYTDEARNRCQSFGDFWAPNFRYDVSDKVWIQPGNVPDYKLDANGNKIPLITCALAPKDTVWNFKLMKNVTVPAVRCFDESRVEFKYDELVACQKPYLDYASTCFDSKGVKLPTCSLPDPA